MMHGYSDPLDQDDAQVSFGINNNDEHNEHTPYQVSRRRTARLIRGLSLLSLILFIIIIILSIYVSKYHTELQDQQNSNNNPIIKPTAAPTDFPTQAPTAPPSNSSQYAEIAAMVMAARNTSIDPCQDFYQYACGGWLTETPLPADQTRWTRTFAVIADKNNIVLRDIAEQDWPVIGAFYKSCMNTDLLDQLGFEPIQKYLAMVQNIKTLDDVMNVTATLVQEIGTHPFMSIGLGVDSKIPEQYLFSIGQGGRTFSILDYYIGPKNKTDSLMNYTKTIFTLLGEDEADAASQARALVDFEFLIAKFSLPPDQLRDPEKTYNKMTLVELNQLTPSFPWNTYFSSLGLPVSDTFTLNLDVPSFTTNITTLLQNTPMDTLRTYLKWRIIYSTSPSLSSLFADAHFQYFGRKISGQDKPAPRWKKCVTNTNNYLPDVMGRYYIQANFPGQSKHDAKAMVQQIKEAFVNSLPNITWMDDATRAAARNKSSMMVDLIGYPSNWTDYSDVHIRRSSYLMNQIVLNSLDWKKSVIQRLNQTVDKNIWQMSPPEVNAYYDPSLNTINFPAGIIQPTFFNITYPKAMNFGGIGMVMGHELTHGFDDQGRQYDGTGRLNPWWRQNVTNAFTTRANCIVNQYSNMVVKDINETINGELTLGENIADNGGIRQAYAAFQAQQKINPDPQIDPEITNEQLFFLAYGQSWCTKANTEYQFKQIKEDPHSPAFARVNGPLQNFPEFSKAFNCPDTSPMNPTNKCDLW